MPDIASIHHNLVEDVRMSEDPSPTGHDNQDTVSALRPDTSGHNLVIKVIDAKTIIDRPARGSLKAQKVVECIVGDETAVVVFTARNEQVDLMKPGTYLKLTNAKVDMVKATMRLAVNAFGKVELADASTDFQPNVDYNISLIEHELVPVNFVAKPQSAEGATDA